MRATLFHRLLRRTLLSASGAVVLASTLAAATPAPETAKSDGASRPKAALATDTRDRRAEAEPAVIRTHQPWVWEVEGNGARFWIAGCLHLGTREDTAYFPAYLPFYDRADLLYFEVPPGAWERPEITSLIRRRGYVRSSKGVAGRVSSETTRQLQRALQAQPGSFDQVRAMEPWLVSLTLAQEGYRRAGLSVRDSMETQLTAQAIADRKPVGGLERPDDQITSMADASARDQERMLQGALINFAQPDFASGPLRRAWRSGELAQIQRAVGVGPELAAEPTHFTTLTQRNMRWIAKMKRIAASGRTALYVVGVEHLISSPGTLPELLRAEGYSVRRVGSPSDKPPLPRLLAKQTPGESEKR